MRNSSQPIQDSYIATQLRNNNVGMYIETSHQAYVMKTRNIPQRMKTK